MSTYTDGLTFKTEKVITKNDIINLCKLLNNREEYINICEFKPEDITEGGIVFKFKNALNEKWYKSVRLCVYSGISKAKGYNICSKGNWYLINENVMNEWNENNDIIFHANIKFPTVLKSFNGAPVFTLEELKIWEECFNQIGIKKIGKYPTKKSLITELII